MNANFNFRYLRNIESSFQLVRILVFVIVLGCIGVASWVAYLSYKTTRESREKIYVLDNGGKSIMLALAQEQNTNRPAEAKDHVKTFLKLFFNQEPDEKAIDANMKQAAYLGDESITRHYLDLREKGFYTKLLQGNTIQKVMIDSVSLDMNKSPYYCTINARIMLVRATNITMRKLIADCYLIDATRTDNNPHGFVIERFRVTDNSDIETINRDHYEGHRP
ncbi:MULTISPECIES: conjugative transposon protein TraK [Spirosoma]|uniref:Bacteroides conjugative transposon TraK protein n=2 Tax=Spirosoma TaxID=107 RepID=A0A1I1ZGF7_9BACT|nr:MULTISPECIES: conjugative transposon protein TraK [Spirosoma]AUD05311.1 conjugative transposon protein TraK [Spirosoma pollinicola]SFE30662.1 Bacteroides conjugative transposon TraK protein [Spirosoma endophyticum]